MCVFVLTQYNHYANLHCNNGAGGTGSLTHTETQARTQAKQPKPHISYTPLNKSVGLDIPYKLYGYCNLAGEWVGSHFIKDKAFDNNIIFLYYYYYF